MIVIKPKQQQTRASLENKTYENRQPSHLHKCFPRKENHHTGALPGDTGQNQGATGRQCQGCNAEGS